MFFKYALINVYRSRIAKCEVNYLPLCDFLIIQCVLNFILIKQTSCIDFLSLDNDCPKFYKKENI